MTSLAQTDRAWSNGTPTQCPSAKVVHFNALPAETPASPDEIDCFLDRLELHFPRGARDDYHDELQNEIRALGLSSSALDAGASALIRGQTSAWFPRLGTILKAISGARDSSRSPLVYVSSGSSHFAAWIEHLAEKGEWLAAMGIEAGCLLVPSLVPPGRRKVASSLPSVECGERR